MHQKFVLLRHQFLPCSALADHWDLMLEVPDDRLDEFAKSGVPGTAASRSHPLMTFEFLHPPTDWRSGLQVQQIGFHRTEYLTYEGPVSGGRGTVARIGQGELHWRELLPTEIEFDLSGSLGPDLNFEGSLGMTRISDKQPQQDADPAEARSADVGRGVAWQVHRFEAWVSMQRG